MKGAWEGGEFLPTETYSLRVLSRFYSSPPSGFRTALAGCLLWAVGPSELPSSSTGRTSIGRHDGLTAWNTYPASGGTSVLIALAAFLPRQTVGVSVVNSSASRSIAVFPRKGMTESATRLIDVRRPRGRRCRKRLLGWLGQGTSRLPLGQATRFRGGYVLELQSSTTRFRRRSSKPSRPRSTTPVLELAFPAKSANFRSAIIRVLENLGDP